MLGVPLGEVEKADDEAPGAARAEERARALLNLGREDFHDPALSHQDVSLASKGVRP